MARTKTLAVRFLPEERGALDRLATRLDQPVSRVVRRVVREALTGGPDHFNDGIVELRKYRRELRAIGVNLNQLAKHANQGDGVVPSSLRDEIRAALEVIREVSEAQREAVERVRRRTLRKADFGPVRYHREGGEA